MTYPRLEVYLNKINHNTSKLVDICKKFEITIVGVTKVFCGETEIANSMVKGGVELLADSRIENLEKLQNINVPKLLLRLPMKSQAEKVVQIADISLNSEIEIIRELAVKALEQEKEHKIILMVDLGDLREGIFKEEEVFSTVSEILKLNGVKLIGLGTNLTCYGGIIPKSDNLGKLVDLGKRIKNTYNIDLEVISGGNSSSINLIEKGQGPEGINQLRLGESIVLGRETAYGNRIVDTYDDCFKLFAEIIEIKEKPSIPIGEIGMDAFGNKPTFNDKGIRKRAICAIGKQDVDLGDLYLEDESISILGGSSDHLILDISESKDEYKLGDIISFKLSYGGILSSMTSPYVYKIFK